MSWVVGLPNNSYKPISITNTTWVLARLCKLQQGCTRLASDKVYQLLAHGRWFSPGTQASSTTKTGRHDITESGVKTPKIKNQSFCRSLFVLFFWPLCCLSFIYLLILITPLVSSNISYIFSCKLNFGSFITS